MARSRDPQGRNRAQGLGTGRRIASPPGAGSLNLIGEPSPPPTSSPSRCSPAPDSSATSCFSSSTSKPGAFKSPTSPPALWTAPRTSRSQPHRSVRWFSPQPSLPHSRPRSSLHQELRLHLVRRGSEGCQTTAQQSESQCLPRDITKASATN